MGNRRELVWILASFAALGAACAGKLVADRSSST